jgi:alkylation response protein AidB-like acyl-CoA dehydrogenase
MWDLPLNDEQAMIAESVREYLARELPLERLRPNAASRNAEEMRGVMGDLGWLGLGLPRNMGGAGLGLIEEMLVQRECARYLVSPSVLATVLGAHVALLAGDTALTLALAAGRTSAALAIVRKADPDSDRKLVYAFDWNPGDPVLLCSEEGMGVFDAAAFSQVQPDACLDDSVTMHAGFLPQDPPPHWISSSQAPLAMRAQVLLAASLMGLAEQACELTVEYAKARQQFGQPIGSFQAVKHRCADMGLRARLGWFQTELACLKVQADSRDAALQAAAAKLTAAHAAHENGRAAIQMLGAIGFQAECDVHWFMKRAHIYDQAGGCMQVQAQRVIAEPSPLW